MIYQRIVVAVNGSPSSGQALQRAIELAAEGHELVVLGIEEPTPRHARPRDPASVNGHLEAIVHAAVERARGAGIDAAGEIRHGYPAEQVLRFSDERQCDLVVLGGGDPKSRRLGRTADKVVDLANCAVLIVR